MYRYTFGKVIRITPPILRIQDLNTDMKDINELFTKDTNENDEELEKELKALLEESEEPENVHLEIGAVEPPRPTFIPPSLNVQMKEQRDITLPTVPPSTPAGMRARQATLADVFAAV